MPALEVRICARGALTDADLLELAGFENEGHGSFVVLRGTVADHPALLGVLERLRRSGLRIRDVEVLVREPASDAGGGPVVARFAFRGRVGGLLRVAVAGGDVIEEPATTTLEVEIGDDGEALFDVLAHLEDLALEFEEIHVRREHEAHDPPADP